MVANDPAMMRGLESTNLSFYSLPRLVLKFNCGRLIDFFVLRWSVRDLHINFWMVKSLEPIFLV